ncbi:MAG: MATE family efflux transporter [Sphaerochaetaceae bacterium]|nr:MATE family efflux transporter [Sphaerochaetaceae bacterium]MDC7248966.1 MATE family efflux transporter [Sphaerochaetaceae bacterium]
MDKNKIYLLETAPVKSAIIKLALPTMLAMAMQMIYNLTDTYFMGQTGDLNLVAAISLASPLIMMFQAAGNIFASGTSCYISQRLGAKDYKEAKRSNSVAFYTAIGIGAVFTLIFLLFQDNILNLIGTSDATKVPTSEYLIVMSTLCIFPILNVTLAGLIRSEGATDKAMTGMVIGLVLNIILDPLFILALNMGTSGAAWATIIGNIVSVGYFIKHFSKKNSLLSIKFKDFKPSRKIYGETFKIGIPAALSSIVMSISFILVNIIASTYGDYVVAGNGIQMRVNSMVIMLIIGLAQGYQPFAGYCYGARKFDRLKSGLKTTMLYGTLVSLFFTLIFIFFGDNIIRLFLDDDLTVQAGAQILRAFTWCVPFFGIQFTVMVTFQATGKAIKAMLISLGRQCIIYLPLLFILNNNFGFKGFIFAQPIADITTTLIAFLLSISFMKEMNKRHENEGVPA